MSCHRCLKTGKLYFPREIFPLKQEQPWSGMITILKTGDVKNCFQSVDRQNCVKVWASLAGSSTSWFFARTIRYWYWGSINNYTTEQYRLFTKLKIYYLHILEMLSTTTYFFLYNFWQFCDKKLMYLEKVFKCLKVSTTKFCVIHLKSTLKT